MLILLIASKTLSSFSLMDVASSSGGFILLRGHSK